MQIIGNAEGLHCTRWNCRTSQHDARRVFAEGSIIEPTKLVRKGAAIPIDISVRCSLVGWVESGGNTV